MFNSPNKYSFKVYLPKFLPNDIADIFSQYLFNETTLPYTNIYDALFNSQILGYEIPELGLDAVNQTKSQGDVAQLQSMTTHAQFGDNRIAVTFRATDGYLNYNLARYAYMLYGMPHLNNEPNKTGALGDLIIAFNTSNALFRYTIVYKQVIWLNVDGKNFKYDDTMQEPDSFALTFAHNGFEILPGINQKIAQSKGLTITT